MQRHIIARNREIQLLNSVWNSKEAEFLVIYGRRRVGKTFLVREFFSERGVYFEVVGLKDGTMQDQLTLFIKALAKTFYPGLSLAIPTTWMEALETLTKAMDAQPKNRKITLFFDELPWLATARSGLLQALDHYWNSSWSCRKNLRLVVCGSAASWILDNLINAKGGLYNRVTNSLLLRPFSLGQTKEFLKAHGVQWNDKQILDLYMATGGVPHYLKGVRKSMSVPQNLEVLCFQSDGLLYNEFPRLFQSLFKAAEANLQIVREAAVGQKGIARDELLKRMSISSGGRFHQRLLELQAAGFIEIYVPYGHKRREQFIRVIDEYSLFYLKWIEPFREKGMMADASGYWQTKAQTAPYLTWAGYAFETVCLKHLTQIKQALHLDKIACETGAWQHREVKGSKTSGAQIDLLFDRDDDVVTLCEIKYSKHKFVIDKSYGQNLLKKIRTFESHFKTQKQVSLVLITPQGLKKNLWSEDLVSDEVTLKDLVK